jgi:hypothetical protein
MESDLNPFHLISLQPAADSSDPLGSGLGNGLRRHSRVVAFSRNNSVTSDYDEPTVSSWTSAGIEAATSGSYGGGVTRRRATSVFSARHRADYFRSPMGGGWAEPGSSNRKLFFDVCQAEGASADNDESSDEDDDDDDEDADARRDENEGEGAGDGEAVDGLSLAMTLRRLERTLTVHFRAVKRRIRRDRAVRRKLRPPAHRHPPEALEPIEERLAFRPDKVRCSWIYAHGRTS